MWLFLLAPPLAGQTYFTPPSDRTGNNATVIIPAASVEGANSEQLEPGDEIAVYSEGGACVGATVWTGDNIALTIWGNDELTDEIDGLQMGEAFDFFIWQADSDEKITDDEGIDVLFSSERPYYRTEQTYAPNAVYVVEALRISPTGTPNVTSN